MKNINLDEILNYIILFLVGFIFFSYLKKSNNVIEYLEIPEKTCGAVYGSPTVRKYTDSCGIRQDTDCENYYSKNDKGKYMPCISTANYGCGMLGGRDASAYNTYKKYECNK